MKKFVNLVLIFSLPLVIGLISFEFLLRNITNDYSYKRDYLDKNAKEIEVLFLGNSHILYGINPEFSSFKSFNVANGSQSLDYDFAIFNKFKNKLKKLKCIVIPIDYTSMYATLGDGVEKWRAKNYTIYFDIKNQNYQYNFEVINGKLLKNLVRIKRFYLNKKSDITCNKLGYGTAFNSKNAKDLVETGKTASKNHTQSRKNNLSFIKNQKSLASIIKLAKQKNIEIIFVSSPTYKTYYEKLDADQLNNTINHIKEITAKNENAHYYNFLKDKRFIASDFFDADHLNEIGAKKFTSIVDSLIQTFEINKFYLTKK